MNKIIATLLATTALAFTATSAMAEPSCNVPKEKWMKESAFKSMVEGQGYTIKTFKVNKGNCYEVYGTKDGKKTEAWFNPETGESLGSK